MDISQLHSLVSGLMLSISVGYGCALFFRLAWAGTLEHTDLSG